MASELSGGVLAPSGDFLKQSSGGVAASALLCSVICKEREGRGERKSPEGWPEKMKMEGWPEKMKIGRIVTSLDMLIEIITSLDNYFKCSRIGHVPRMIKMMMM